VSEATGVSRAPLIRRLSTQQSFFFAIRQVSSSVGERLRDLKLPGVEVHEEWRREYPHHALAAHLLGFVGTDGEGMCGLEHQYDHLLSGSERQVLMVRDGLRVPFQQHGTDRGPPPGLEVTLDIPLQAAADEVLKEGVARAGTRAGVAIVMDPRDGAILAMASHPTFDPMKRETRTKTRIRNLATSMTFEPGSVLKALVVAAALDARALRLSEVLDLGNGRLPLPRRALHDHDRRLRGPAGLRKVMALSSNVGAAKIALRLSPEDLHAAYRRFGIGEPTGIDLPGEEAGIFRPPDAWTVRTPAMLAIGQEVSTTPLGVLTAFAAIAREGLRPTPHLARAWIEPDGSRRPLESPPRTRVLEPEAANQTVRLLEAVVLEGTGQSAAVPGYRLAGKTGTAQKAVPGHGYRDGLHVSTFVGFGPLPHPEVAVIVVMDEPTHGHFAAEVAAPVWSQLMATALRILRIPAAGREVTLAAPGPPASPTGGRGTPDPSRTASGSMPDLAGLGLREALGTLTAAGYRAEAVGAGGVVGRQDPAPGTPAEAGAICTLFLSEPV
jgi:cell division protein FtsI/penicillin-binding protein 2